MELLGLDPFDFRRSLLFVYDDDDDDDDDDDIIIIINLIYMAQFDTNGILTGLCIVKTYKQIQYVHI